MPSAGARILLIEDAKDFRAMLKELLELDGHEVQWAEDGPSGLAAACRPPYPEVVLIDIALPGLDGYEIARRIRAVRGDQVRLIAITGFDNPQRAAEAGFDAHFLKGNSTDQLRALIRGDGT
jgi:CheY-like chemotaxis protein